MRFLLKRITVTFSSWGGVTLRYKKANSQVSAIATNQVRLSFSDWVLGLFPESPLTLLRAAYFSKVVAKEFNCRESIFVVFIRF